MTFKMKGPGLPGFRKQQGSGFYKSNPIPRTDNRSPIKQGSDDARQAEIEKAREKVKQQKKQEKKTEKRSGNKKVRCFATKANGRRCKNMTDNKNKKCYAHQ